MHRKYPEFEDCIIIFFVIGGFGIVYKGLLKNWEPTPTQEVAVKTLKGVECMRYLRLVIINYYYVYLFSTQLGIIHMLFQVYSIKIFFVDVTTLSDLEGVVSKIIKMKELSHPNLMLLIGVCLDSGPSVSVVMPYMINGSLLDYVRRERCSLEIKDDCPETVNFFSFEYLIL